MRTKRFEIDTVKCWFLLLSLGLAIPVHAQVSELTVTDQDNGRTIMALVGQSIRVNLAGNASTGYSWLITTNQGNAVSETGPATYIPNGGGGAGSGGVYSFAFHADQAGQTLLSFEYARSWEPGSGIRTFRVSFDVRNPSDLPRLTVRLEAGRFAIRWPTNNSQGFFLEGCGTLPSPGWAAPNALVAIDGDNFKVSLPRAGSQLFFRLRQ